MNGISCEKKAGESAFCSVMWRSTNSDALKSISAPSADMVHMPVSCMVDATEVIQLYVTLWEEMEKTFRMLCTAS